LQARLAEGYLELGRTLARMEHATKSRSEAQSRPASEERRGGPGIIAPRIDQEAGALACGELADVIHLSPRTVTQRALAQAMDRSPRVAALRASSLGMNSRPLTAGQRTAPRSGLWPASAGGPVVQGVFEWFWAALGYPGGGGGAAARLGGEAAVAPGPLAEAPSEPVAAEAVAPTPAQISERLLAAEAVYNRAAQTLPGEIREPWQAPEPAPVEAELRGVYAPLRGLEAFPDGDAEAADERATRIEGLAEAYRTYCRDVLPHLRDACAERMAYRSQLTDADARLFEDLCSSVEQGTETLEDTRIRCRVFIQAVRASSARDSDGLHALMVASPVQARKLVSAYFAQGRLRIGRWRDGYASKHDASRGAFGAEWILSAPDPALGDIARHWVFHTHAVSDAALNFTISRAMGASHIKRQQDALASGVSISFVDDAEFSRVENDEATRKSFESWVRRTGAEALRNTKKRK